MTFTGSNRHTRGTATATAQHSTSVVVRGALAWRRAKSALSRGVAVLRDSVRPQGWLTLGGATVGLILGLAFGWGELVAAGIVSLVLIICALPFLFGVKAYRVLLKIDQSRIIVGDEADAALVIENMGRRPALPGVIDLPIGEGLIEVDVPLLRGKQEHAEAMRIPGNKRGVVEVGPARTVRQDVLGLFRRERTWQEAQTLFIHPRTTVLPSMSSGLIRDLEGQASAVIVPDDLSFHAIRDYQVGDSRRHVHWKSTAKTGKLMVRQYEETRRSGISIVLGLDPEEYRDAEEFELAVSVAGSLALRGLQDGREVQCVVPGEAPSFATLPDPVIAHLSARSPRIMLDQLSGLNFGPDTHALPEAARLVGSEVTHASLAFLVCGSAMTARDIQRACLAFAPDVTVIAVKCDQHAEPALWSVADTPVLSVGILEDLPHLLLRSAHA